MDSSFEQLVSHMHLRKEDVNKQITDEHIEVISRNSCSQWKSLPAHLGLPPITAKDIDLGPGDEREKRNTFLTTWKAKKGSEATYKKLISALLKIEHREDAEYVCKLLINAQTQLHEQVEHQQQQPEGRQQQPEHRQQQPEGRQQQLGDGQQHQAEATRSFPDHVEIFQDQAPQASDSDLDPEVKEDLKMELRHNLEAIRNRYASYVSHIYESIKDTVHVESLRVYLLDLSALDCDNDDDEEQYKLLSAVRTKISQAKSIHDIVISLQLNCATFLHYDVFHLIQKQYKVAISEELNYPEHFKAYINKHKLSEFIKTNPKLEKIIIPVTSERLILKFDIPHTSRVARVIDLKVSIAKILHLKPSALQLLNIDKGCVEVTFLIPSNVADFVFKKLSSKQIEELQVLPVIWLKCHHYNYHFNRKDYQTDSEENMHLDDTQVKDSDQGSSLKGKAKNEDCTTEKLFFNRKLMKDSRNCYPGKKDSTKNAAGKILSSSQSLLPDSASTVKADSLTYIHYSTGYKVQGHTVQGYGYEGHAGQGLERVDDHGGHAGQGLEKVDYHGGHAGQGLEKVDYHGGHAGQGLEKVDYHGGHAGQGLERVDYHGGHAGQGLERVDYHGGHAGQGLERVDYHGGHAGQGLERVDYHGGHAGRGCRGHGNRGGRRSKRGLSLGKEYISEEDLQTLSQGSPENVLSLVNDNASKFLSTYKMRKLCTHPLHLKRLVKLLALLVRCEDQSIASQMLAVILSADGEYALFITKIDNLLKEMVYEQRDHVKRGNLSLLDHLIEIGSMAIKTIPSTVVKTYPVTVMENTIQELADMEENVDLIAKKFKEMNTDFRLAKKEEALQKKPSVGSEGEPPKPFTELSILPTLEEMRMRSKNVFLRPNKIRGSYSDWGHYFDVQFRLLREDFIRPLREGVSSYYYMEKGTGDIREYEGAKVLNPVCLNTGIGFQVRFDVSKFSRVNWEHSKRLIFGSLLCLSNDNFNQCMLFATVVKRDEKLLKDGLLTIQFENGADGFQIDPTEPYKMAESPAYYEAYCHILKSLQDLSATPDVMPLKKYIIECDFNDVRVPSFLRISSRSPQFDMTDIIFSQTRYLTVRKSFDITGLRTWPNACYTDLDESQLRAVKMALTKEVSVIQGPPGTGKTYIGLKIVEAYLKNRTVWDPQKKAPILVVCFTNHALDQFLVDIKKLSVNGDSPNIIRVGGRCKSEELKSCILREKVNECRSNRSVPTHLFKDYKDACSTRFDGQKFISSQLQSCDAESDKKIISLNNLRMVLDLQFVEQLQNGVESAYGKEVEVWLGLRFSEGFESHAPQEVFQQVQPQDDDPSSSDDEYIEVDNEARTLQDDRIIAGDVIEVIAAGRSGKKVKVPTKLPKKKDQFGWKTVQLTDMQRKKRISQGFKNEPMTSRDASRVRNVWKLSSKNRWKLYLHWTIEYIKHCKEKIRTKARDYTLTCNLFAEAQQKIDSFVAAGADVIGMTTTGAAKYHHLLKQVHPKIVIFEEAAEILEAHVITSLASSVQQLILIGDHKQLKPKPTCYDLEKKYHLDVSFFERLINNGFDHVTLQQQHRMRPEISKLLCPTIYKNLLDHADVKKYDSVLGIEKNVFFVDHVHPEEHHGSSDTKSHVNKFEAEFIVELCHYLLKQGYSPSEITILTMYRGQLFELKKRMTKKKFEGVRVAAVDDFQGEENEIILLSLVRSNSDGIIGFLSIENRVCVSLSRAKKGLYVIGNLSMLREGKGMDTKWPEIIHHLEKVKCVGPALPLYCQNHPEDKIAICNPRDFLQRPEGGCTRVCGLRLSCGHTCEQICHPRDKEHKLITCSKVCGNTLACGHTCKQKCYKCKKKGSCSPCSEYMSKVLPRCGHVVTLTCSTNLASAPCPLPCEKLLPCGHKCQNTCSDSCTTKCREKVKKLLPCEHQPIVSCFEEPSSLSCPEKCKAVLECGDVCSGTCGKCQRGRLHIKCLQKCGRDLVCGHPCKYPCASICPPCEMPCNNYCFHSKCPKKCYEPCDPCMEPCKWACRHYKCTKPCGMLCNRPPCDHPCTKILKCGHQCIGLCGEKCPEKCRVCHKDEVCEIFFGDEDEDNALFIELQDCSHIIEVKGLDNWIKQDSQASSGSSQVQFKTCPKCKTPIRKSLRYGNIVKKVLSDVEGIKSQQLKTLSDLPLRFAEANAAILKLSDTSYVQRDLEHLQQSLQPVSNWYRATVIKFQLSILPNMLKVYHIINTNLKSIDRVKVSGCSPRYLDESLSNLKMFVMQEFLSAQQRADSISELRRLTCAAKLLELLSKIQSKNCPERNMIIHNIKHVYLSGWKRGKITEEKAEGICEFIKSISEKYEVDGLSKEERLKIVEAVGLTKGHWFKCPKGHFYCIGECGGAMETSKCPECGNVIGGQNHSLAEGNEHAGEMDDSRHAAWSDAANTSYGFLGDTHSKSSYSASIKGIIQVVMVENGVSKEDIPGERQFTSPRDTRGSKRYFDVKGFAWYTCPEDGKRWASSHSWGIIDLKKQELCYDYTQDCNQCESEVHPEFTEESIERMAQYAVRQYLIRTGEIDTVFKPHIDDIDKGPHDEERCGKCLALGYNCMQYPIRTGDIHAVFKPRIDDIDKGPHDKERCGKCSALGYNCMQ